jgi:hypothetical protein
MTRAQSTSATVRRPLVRSLRRAAQAARRDPLRTMSLYYVTTGVWPIVSLRTFMLITGPKTDTWLVQTFGAFIAATGSALWPRPATNDGRRVQVDAAVAAAFTLAVCDVFFVARRRISPIYLGDAIVELLLAGAVLNQANTDSSR